MLTPPPLDTTPHLRICACGESLFCLESLILGYGRSTIDVSGRWWVLQGVLSCKAAGGYPRGYKGTGGQ